jgi:2-dehydropantoate 2-reductase
MNILIFGAGAIGSHLAYCLKDKKNNIILLSKKKYIKAMRYNGLNLNIYSNEKLKKKILLKESKNFKFEFNLKKINKIFKEQCDVIFVTVKLKDFKLNIFKEITNLCNKNSLLVLPCTYLPPWWFNGIFKSNKVKNINKEIKISKKYQDNMVGMTMWLSGKMKKPGYAEIKHVQRGYPIKEVHPSKKSTTNKLRTIIKKKCISPNVRNIYSEIYIKAINSFAFNLMALDTEQNNFQLKKNENAIKSINKIFFEFDSIVSSLGIPIFQSASSRINQTLSSTRHTLSMLTDFKRGKKVEIAYLWKTLLLLANLSKKKINFSKKIYKKVLIKLKKNGNLA